jgi:hypothetical protein
VELLSRARSVLDRVAEQLLRQEMLNEEEFSALRTQLAAAA